MTITDADFESLIDVTPWSPAYVDCRYAYADWLEERGDSAGAMFQRWMGDFRRGPCKRWFSEGLFPPAPHWWHDIPSIVPRKAFVRLAPGVETNPYDILYATRMDADAALRTALEAVGYDVPTGLPLAARGR